MLAFPDPKPRAQQESAPVRDSSECAYLLSDLISCTIVDWLLAMPFSVIWLPGSLHSNQLKSMRRFWSSTSQCNTPSGDSGPHSLPGPFILGAQYESSIIGIQPHISAHPVWQHRASHRATLLGVLRSGTCPGISEHAAEAYWAVCASPQPSLFPEWSGRRFLGTICKAHSFVERPSRNVVLLWSRWQKVLGPACKVNWTFVSTKLVQALDETWDWYGIKYGMFSSNSIQCFSS